MLVLFLYVSDALFFIGRHVFAWALQGRNKTGLERHRTARRYKTQENRSL
jgi:hypothetical protein